MGMTRIVICVSCLSAALLSGCGVGETAVGAAAAGKAKAEEAKQAQQALQHVQQQLDAANAQAEAQRKALDEATK